MFIVRFQRRDLLRLLRVFFALPQNGRPLLSLTVWLTPQAALSQDGCHLRMISGGKARENGCPRLWGAETGELQGNVGSSKEKRLGAEWGDVG